MKIICVGLNYKSHNIEMKRDSDAIPTDPVLFLKPDTSILKDNKPFYIPDFSSKIEHEVEVVIKINRLGKNIAERFAHRYYDEITVGIDFTARNLQAQLKSKGLPWEISKGFDGSAVLGKFISKNELNNSTNRLDFTLLKNNIEVQKGNTSEMLYSIDQIIAYASKFFTLKIGDIIFTGTPSGVSNIQIGDKLIATLDNKELLNFNIR